MQHFNDDDSKIGVEGKHWLDGNARDCFDVDPTNHPDDWKTNLFSWPRRDGKHRAWQRDGAFLAEHIGEIVAPGGEVLIRGLSRGGAVALIAGDYLISAGYKVTVDTWGSPKPGRLENEIPGRDYRLRGDIVPSLPLLYRRPRGRRFRLGRWRPIIAHTEYKVPRGNRHE